MLFELLGETLKYRMLVKIESQEYLWGAVIHCPNTLCQLWQALKVYAILSLLFFEVWHLEFTCSSTKKYFQFQPVAKQFKATKNHDPFAWYSDRVFNKFLPFDFCILHLGSKKWTLCSISIVISSLAIMQSKSFKALLHFYFHHQQKIMVLCREQAQWFLLLTIKKFGEENIKRNKSGWRLQTHVLQYFFTILLLDVA